MATFRKRVTKTKGTVWDVIIRKKGFSDLKRTFPHKNQARAWAAEQELAMDMKRNGDPRLAQQITLAEALEKYTEDSVFEGKKATTLDREQRSYKHILRLLGSETALARIDGPLVHKYQVKRKGEGASSSSIRQELCIISKMYNNTKKLHGINVSNPVNDIVRIPPKKGKERFLTKEEAAALVKIAKQSRNKKFFGYVILLLHTGMRSHEAVTLRQNDVDFENRYIKIYSESTKTEKPRTVPLTQEVIAALQAITLEEDGYFFLKKHHRKKENLMRNPGQIFRECFATARKKLPKLDSKIEDFTPHDLRHTAASHLLMSGADIRVVADILGHTTLAMTMRYTHLLNDFKQDVVDKIGHLGS